MNSRIVVAGAGQAAAAFAAKLRELDETAEITLIGDEPVLPYQRPPLSKKYMTGELAFDQLLLRPADWYEANRIECITGRRVTAIRPADNAVDTDSGASYSFDKLLLATGAAPRELQSVIGGDLQGVHVLRGIADADALMREFKPGRTVLVLGGGYIGLEAAAVAASMGLTVQVVETAERILKRVAAPMTADHFRKLHSEHGVTIRENTTLAHLEEEAGRVSRAVFRDGSALDVDFVLVGIGVLPNDDLARDAGLDIDDGIAVDPSTRASHPDIHAAGDCASFEFRGRRVRLESVQNAVDQAETAARVIAGEDVEYRPVPWFWSDQYDTKLQIAGLNSGYDQTVGRPGTRDGGRSVWYFAAGRFIAVDAINDSRAYMVGKRLLETGREITPEQAAETDLDLKTLLS